MHRLSGEDAGFLSMEQPEQAMNTIAVGTLRSPDGSAAPLTIEDKTVEEAVDLDDRDPPPSGPGVGPGPDHGAGRPDQSGFGGPGGA